MLGTGQACGVAREGHIITSRDESSGRVSSRDYGQDLVSDVTNNSDGVRRGQISLIVTGCE